VQWAVCVVIVVDLCSYICTGLLVVDLCLKFVVLQKLASH